MGISVVTVQAPHNLQSIPLSHSKTTLFQGSTTLKRHQWNSKPVNSLSLSSSSSSSSSSWSRCSASVVEEGSPAPSPPSDVQPDSAIDDSVKLSLSGCKACGREEVEKGCNGEGRIQGGIATVPGFGWWPIKAYRPCPGFLAAGGRYRRSGQSMDEVAFGRGKREASEDTGSKG